MSLVLPGESISLPSGPSLTLGPGLRASSSRSIDPLGDDAPKTEEAVVSTRMGLLGSAREKGKGKANGERLWIEGSSKRYIAAPKELVLGTIVARHAEGYRVDIGTAQMASLDGLAFEGATKRSKPNLKVGTLVYARVSIASRDMEPELECVDATTGKSEGFGELKGGLVISTSLEFARQLLTPKHPLLPLIAAQFPFEIAIGMNGRIWFKAAQVDQTIALKRVLEGVHRGEIGMEGKSVASAIKAMV